MSQTPLAVTHVGDTCVRVSVQHGQQQEGDVFQDLQQLDGRAPVQKVRDAARVFKQTPLEGAENTCQTFHVENSKVRNTVIKLQLIRQLLSHFSP